MVKATLDVYLTRNSKTPDLTFTTKGETIYFTKQKSMNEFKWYVRTNQLTNIYYFEVIVEDDKSGEYLDADAGYLQNDIFYAC